MSTEAATNLSRALLKDQYVCEMTESMTIIESGICIKLYGLVLHNTSPYLSEKEGEYCRVDGISEDYQSVLRLKNLIEELEVYPVHLREIVEDFLS